MKKSLLVVSSIILCGCAQTKIIEKKVPVPYAVRVYPNLPDIEVPEAEYNPVEFQTAPAGSGLYVGLDKENAGKLIENAAKAGEREVLLGTVVDLENKRRADWRAQNQTELSAAPELPEDIDCFCDVGAGMCQCPIDEYVEEDVAE